jgi:translation initiation factor IF-2
MRFTCLPAKNQGRGPRNKAAAEGQARPGGSGEDQQQDRQKGGPPHKPSSASRRASQAGTLAQGTDRPQPNTERTKHPRRREQHPQAKTLNPPGRQGTGNTAAAANRQERGTKTQNKSTRASAPWLPPQTHRPPQKAAESPPTPNPVQAGATSPPLPCNRTPRPAPEGHGGRARTRRFDTERPRKGWSGATPPQPRGATPSAAKSASAPQNEATATTAAACTPPAGKAASSVMPAADPLGRDHRPRSIASTAAKHTTSHTGGAIPCGGLASQRSACVTAPPPPRGQVLPAPLQPPGRPKSSGPGGWAPSPHRTGRAALTGARASSPQAGSRQQSAARRRPCADSPTARPTAAPGWRGGRAHRLAAGGGAGPPRPGRPHAARPAPGGGRPAGGPWRH